MVKEIISGIRTIRKEKNISFKDTIELSVINNENLKEDYDDGLKTFINDELPKMTLVSMKQGGVLDAETMIPYDEWNKANAPINVGWRNSPDGTGVELVWFNALGTWPVSQSLSEAITTLT